MQTTNLHQIHTLEEHRKAWSMTFMLFVSLFLNHTLVFGQHKKFFDSTEGLSNSLINQVQQDKQGFIWVATENGLNRFDGLKFKTFHQNKKKGSLKSSFVKSLMLDSAGNLWVGMVNGLQVYDPNIETFKEVEFYISNKRVHPYISALLQSSTGDIWVVTSGFGLFQIPKDVGRPRYSSRLNKHFNSLYLQSICEDKNGLLWIGTHNEGLNTYNPETGAVESYKSSAEAPFRIPHNDISSIAKDHLGNIYVGSVEGSLARINVDDRTIERITPKDTHFPVKNLFFGSKQRLWIGTDGVGLKLFNVEKQTMESISPANSSFDFSKSKIHSIAEDNAGNLWLGVFQKGVFLLPEAPEIFRHYGYRAFGENSIGSSCVTSIDGTDSELWVGTDGDGLYKIDRQTNQIEHILLKDAGNHTQGSNVMSVYNAENEVWIGTFFNGLLRYDKRTGYTSSLRNSAGATTEIYDKISVVKPGREGELLLGTMGWGVCRFDTKKQHFKPLQFPDSIIAEIPKWVNDFHYDTDSNLWVATYDGLMLVRQKEKTAQLLTEANGFLPNNVVYSIHRAGKDHLWVGTYSGLVKINRTSLKTTYYNTSDGLCNDVVCAILQDKHDKLWLSTHNGLSHFAPDSSSFTNYYTYDGIQSNEFYRSSALKTQDGTLFFGGINGITEIKKDYKNYSRQVGDVMLTDFSRFNSQVQIGEKTGSYVILNKSIVLADTVQLAERDNVFSIGFSSVELANQSRISYQYRMQGFDQNWNSSSATSPKATYTNLPHGQYSFWVRGVDKGQFSEVRKLTIIIHPPWYKTLWARAIWFLAVGLILLGIFYINHERLMREEAERLNEKKMQFFINISHEIRTPLTLIIDPLEKLMRKKVDSDTSRIYNTMQQNANRIFRLINQLLDIRKIDKGQILVKYQKTRLFSFIKEIAQSYELLAQNKKIDFRIETTDSEIEAWIDPLNFEKIILNLLSNAFKFTPEGGEVILSIQSENHIDKNRHFAKIIVSDNGIGIKKADLERVFERFYQVPDKISSSGSGTGIGLHLSRSLVELHKGKLYAENRNDGQGTNFVILLPLGNDHLPKEDLITEENRLPAPSQRFYPKMQDKQPTNNKKNKPKNDFKVMIVDDEEEIRNYLAYELGQEYNIVACENGKRAFEQLHKEQPELIISDIMMPEMDGIALCKKIKGNAETSHIPVILLTALSRDEDKAEGIETGADMYLVKPFNSEFLKKTVANIFENRRRLIEKVGNKGEKYEVEAPEVQSHDEILMQKVMTIIKKNIGNSDLNVEMLAEGVGISRVHMHRKLKELTHQSARDFIKGIRMKQAAYLLVNKSLNVSEVAYAVGYSNLSHFSTSFKNFYGISPKEYAAQEEEKQQ